MKQWKETLYVKKKKNKQTKEMVLKKEPDSRFTCWGPGEGDTDDETQESEENLYNERWFLQEEEHMCNHKQLCQSEETKAVNENEKQRLKGIYGGESRRFKDRDWMVENSFFL